MLADPKKLQEREFAMERDSYMETKHQSFVGAGYFEKAQIAVTGEDISTTVLKGSTEEEQVTEPVH